MTFAVEGAQAVLHAGQPEMPASFITFRHRRLDVQTATIVGEGNFDGLICVTELRTDFCRTRMLERIRQGFFKGEKEIVPCFSGKLDVRQILGE